MWTSCKLRLILLLCAGLLLSVVAAEGWSANSCKVPGFTLRQRQQPGLSKGDKPDNDIRLEFYTYPPPAARNNPRPYPSLAETAAACTSNPQCIMFTSDGYLIAAHSLYAGPNKPASERDIAWQQMAYCSGTCCGTWVADAFNAQLALPADNDVSAQQQPLVQTTRDKVTLDSGLYEIYKLAPALMQTVCAEKAAPPPLGSGVGTPACPQRCVVACCKQLQAGERVMGRYFFSQCSGKACRECALSNEVVASNQMGKVLLRQYMREKSVEQSKVPSSPAVPAASTVRG